MRTHLQFVDRKSIWRPVVQRAQPRSYIVQHSYNNRTTHTSRASSRGVKSQSRYRGILIRSQHRSIIIATTDRPTDQRLPACCCSCTYRAVSCCTWRHLLRMILHLLMMLGSQHWSPNWMMMMMMLLLLYIRRKRRISLGSLAQRLLAGRTDGRTAKSATCRIHNQALYKPLPPKQHQRPAIYSWTISRSRTQPSLNSLSLSLWTQSLALNSLSLSLVSLSLSTHSLNSLTQHLSLHLVSVSRSLCALRCMILILPSLPLSLSLSLSLCLSLLSLSLPVSPAPDVLVWIDCPTCAWSAEEIADLAPNAET